MGPEEYPADVTVSDEAYEAVKELFTDPDNERYKGYTEEWPPTDAAGNVYPIWFTVEELNDRGELIDQRGNNYNPFTGNMEPIVEGKERCNTPVNEWRRRYPDIRFCGQIIEMRTDETFCHFHENRFVAEDTQGNMKSAEEHLQTGLHTTTIDHLYEDLGPWKKLLGHGLYESLLGESTYDFAVEYEPREFDFSCAETRPLDVDEDDILSVTVGYPTEHLDAALSLYVAAMMRVQMLTVQPRIMYEDHEDGQGMMESETYEATQLTSPTESDPSQEWRTLKSWSEHHLNLPFSRLFNDMESALERGGIQIDPESESDSMDDDDIVLEIEADANALDTTDDTGTDPNAYGDDYTAESEKIKEHVTGND